MGKFNKRKIFQHDKGDNGKVSTTNQFQSKFEVNKHSANGIYTSVAKVLDKMEKNKIGLKEAFAKTKIDKDIIYQVFAIASKVVNNGKQCDDIIKDSQLMDENLPENKNLIKSMVTDLIWGCKQILGEGPISDSVLLKKDILVKLSKNYEGDAAKFQKIIFARVNTITYTVEEFLNHLEESGYKLIETPTSYDQYLKALHRLKPKSFIKDYHFDDLFAFLMKEKATLWADAVFKNNFIAFQDKSSLLPVNLLKIERGSTVLDMCAAPGMKTFHLAAQLQGKGQVLAVDMDKKRYQTMIKMIDAFGATKLVKPFNIDITKFECNSDEIDFVLLDAPCSGSGIRTRLGGTDNNADRLRRLQWLQMKFLTQALTQYPNAKRVVYSTCSINTEENEAVVEEVMDKLGDKILYDLIDCHELVDGFSRGSSDHKHGSFCLKVDMQTHFSNGFFVAVFERNKRCPDGNDDKKQISNSEATSVNVMKGKKNSKQDKLKQTTVSDTDALSDTSRVKKNRKKNKKQKDPLCETDNTLNEIPSVKKSKNKQMIKKKQLSDDTTSSKTKQFGETESTPTSLKKQKKKRNKQATDTNNSFTVSELDDSSSHLQEESLSHKLTGKVNQNKRKRNKTNEPTQFTENQSPKKKMKLSKKQKKKLN